MYFKNENSAPHSIATPPKYSLEELKRQHNSFTLDCGFFRAHVKTRIEKLNQDYGALCTLLEKTIEQVEEQIITNQNRIKDVSYYGEDGEYLKSRIISENERQKKYIENIQLQIERAKSLQYLYSLDSTQLFQEVLKNKSSVLLILQTPKLIIKIPNHQLVEITDNDPEIIKEFASLLATQEYTTELTKVFTALKLQVSEVGLQRFIEGKENEVIHDLLIKINFYLDKKIDRALKKNSYPWALGYFGSNYKLIAGDKKVSIPHGIYEIKSYLEQIGKIPGRDILNKIQTTLHIKNIENQDESLFQKIKWAISCLFGFCQSQETAKEYAFLEEVAAGKKSIS